MRKIVLFLSFLIIARMASAQEPLATPTADMNGSDTLSTMAVPVQHHALIKKWSMDAVPWDEWFKDNAQVTDKTDYVHFFWNAQDLRDNFKGKDKKRRLAESALEMAVKLQPETATSDLAKVDIVYVLQRDNYGQPRWNTMHRVAHYEFSRTSAVEWSKENKPLTEARMKKIFSAVEFY